MQFKFESIGVIHSCYKEKFAIPRQAGLVASGSATLELLPPYNHPEVVRGLEGFSHLWVIFVFHQHLSKGWSPTVRPPRADGKRYGVFATRSTFRPNPIGQSVVEMSHIEQQKQQLLIHLKGIDLLDGTPVLDIKPYIPYSDSLGNARAGFTNTFADTEYEVIFSENALLDCYKAIKSYPEIKEFIKQLLRLDPRPAYMKKINKSYSSRVYEYDLKWRIKNDQVLVLSLKKYADRTEK